MKNFKEIEDYYRGNISEQARLDFELLLKTNVELRSEYDTYRASQSLIEYMIGQDLIQKLHDFNSDKAGFQSTSMLYSEPASDLSVRADISSKIVSINRDRENIAANNFERKRIGSIWKISAAATILILISIFSVTFYFVRSNDFSKITNENISYMQLSQMRGESNIQKYQKLIHLQSDGNYGASNKLIDELMTDDPIKYDYLVYFKGQNNFRLKNYVLADKQFEEVINLKLSKYVEHAQLMQVFVAIESKNFALAESRITQLERLPEYSYRKVLERVKIQLKNK